MTEWPGEALGRAGTPRPLSPELHRRLEETLLAECAPAGGRSRSLDGEVSSRLRGALRDPLTGVLGNIDGPRPLRPATNRTLERAFARRKGKRRVAVLGAAAAVAVLAAGLTVALSGGSSPRTSTEALAPPTSSHPNGRSATSGGAGSSNGSPAPAAGNTTGAPQALGAGRASAAYGSEALSAPTATAISPSSGPTRGGTVVTITGTGLGGVTSVRFGTVTAHFQIVSATQLRAVSPTHAKGTATITLTTTSGRAVPSDDLRFTYH